MTVHEFEHEGVWWDPQHTDEQWIGTLRFNEREGATLTIIVPEVIGNPFHDRGPYPVILGVSTDGKAISLLGCYERSSSGFFGPVPRRTEIYVNRLILGVHVDNPDPLVSSVLVTFQHLNDWRRHHGIALNYRANSTDFEARYTAPEPLVVYDDGAWQVSMRVGLSGSAGGEQVGLKEATRLEIEAVTPQRLSDFQRRVQECGDLLTIFCSTRCAIDDLEITFPSDAGERAPQGTFHAVPHYERNSRRASVLTRGLVLFSDIADRAPERISRWLSEAETLNDVRALYTVGVYGGGFIQMRLIALTQAVEALHRRQYPGLYMDPEEFKSQVFEPMKAAIPASLSKSHRAAIASRLRFANQISQAKRMEALFEEHEATLRILVVNPLEWVKPILGHRNAFTHFDPAPDLQPAGGADDVLRYNWLLRLLLEACFLKTMGFTNQEITGYAARSETYRQLAAGLFRGKSGPGSEVIE